MFKLLLCILVIVQVFVLVKLDKCLERVEDNLVDIEVTYERMRGVIEYLKDCIERSGN